MTTSKITVGVVGCGVISDAYLSAASQFDVIDIISCSDINSDAAKSKAEKYNLGWCDVDALLSDASIDIVLNLTTPQHHASVGLAALAAGKHVYSEKPLAISVAEAHKLAAKSIKNGLRVGCAPDTFFGAAQQTTRKIIDTGKIGDIVAGSASMMVPGHELWHPNPDFYYQPGGGPLMDMGPYYLTALVNMIGPVQEVVGMDKVTVPSRTIMSGAREGEEFSVNVPTHVSAILKFANGAIITLTTSFDIKKHNHSFIELYGSKGSILVSDPNKFGGKIEFSNGENVWQEAEQTHLYGGDDHRIIGLVDMAQAILSDRPHRASMELSLHVLEVMEAISKSAADGTTISIHYSCKRPAPLPENLPFGQLD